MTVWNVAVGKKTWRPLLFYFMSFQNFDEHTWPQGCFVLKNCIKPKVNAYRLPSIILLCITPKLLNFIWQTRKQTIFEDFDRRFSLGLHGIKKQKVLRIWGGGAFHKNNIILTTDFNTPWHRDTAFALGVHRIKKCSKQGLTRACFYRRSFKEKC